MEVIRTEQLLRRFILGKEIIEVLKGIDISIQKNEYVAFMGPSGSGKSTFMNIIGCLDSPSGGKYLLNGKDVSKLNDNQLAEIRNHEIGFIFQTFNLLPRYTALENVALTLIYARVSKSKSVERANSVL